MKKGFAVFIALVAVISLTQMVAADGPSIKPGKWEFTTTVNFPMMPEPKVTTETKCVTEEEASGDPLAAMVEEARCTVLNKKVDGNSVEFEIECEGDMGMKSRGKGKFTADGTTASGTMEMTVEMTKMGGKSMKMTQSWEGKRIGDCEQQQE